MNDTDSDLAYTRTPPRDPITEEQLIAQLRNDALWLTEHTSTATNGIVRRLLTAAHLIEHLRREDQLLHAERGSLSARLGDVLDAIGDVELLRAFVHDHNNIMLRKVATRIADAAAQDLGHDHQKDSEGA